MSLIRVGSFAGRWHGDPVRFSVQQVFGNGAFNGVGEFTGGPHQGIQFGFTGFVTSSGGITVNRDVGIGTQIASDAAFEIANNECVWKGLTTGPGIGQGGLPFELRVPSLVKTGQFQGLWHGDQVTFKFVQLFTSGQFNGVGKFAAGQHNGTEFGFTGFMTGSGGIRIDRAVGTGTQSAFDATPQIVGNTCVWQGITTGVGIGPPGLPFKLSVGL